VSRTTARLLHDHADLSRILGSNYLDLLVYPHIVKDATKTILPLVLRHENKDTVLVSDGDSALITALPVAPLEFAVHGRYFTWNDNPPALTLPQLIRQLAPGASIEVNDTLPLGTHARLRSSLDILVKPTHAAPQPVRHFTVPRARVSEQMATGMERFRQAALRISAGFRAADELAALLRNTTDPGFALLDELMEEANLEALLVTSPFQIEELSGYPSTWLEPLNAALLVRKGDEDLHLFVGGHGSLPDAESHGAFAALGEAVRALTTAVPAVEHGHADLKLARQLNAGPADLANASPIIHHWQELRATSQLPYYLLAANSVREALDSTVELTARRLAEGGELRESELARAFDAYLGRFAAEHDLHGFIRPYFRIVHPGERTLVPAAPSPNLLTGSNQTIKFDMGAQVLDQTGRVRGCSDIARTYCATAELQEFHALLRTLLLDKLIPAIRPGMTGAEIHRIGIEALAEHDPQFHAWGVLPEGRSSLEYARDCGHVINRQTICTIYFTPDCTTPVEAGMSGCVEYVWPVGELIIAVEEAYVITDSGAIAITA
jgi:Xaa-Pro aminopeptidase